MNKRSIVSLTIFFKKHEAEVTLRHLHWTLLDTAQLFHKFITHTVAPNTAVVVWRLLDNKLVDAIFLLLSLRSLHTYHTVEWMGEKKEWFIPDDTRFEIGCIFWMTKRSNREVDGRDTVGITFTAVTCSQGQRNVYAQQTFKGELALVE